MGLLSIFSRRLKEAASSSTEVNQIKPKASSNSLISITDGALDNLTNEKKPADTENKNEQAVSSILNRRVTFSEVKHLKIDKN